MTRVLSCAISRRYACLSPECFNTVSKTRMISSSSWASLFMVCGHLLEQPVPSREPLTLESSQGNLQNRRGLVFSEPQEEPHFHDVALQRIFLFELFEESINGYRHIQLGSSACNPCREVLHREELKIRSRTRVVDENVPHDSSGDCEEVGAVLQFQRLCPGESYIDFVE